MHTLYMRNFLTLEVSRQLGIKQAIYFYFAIKTHGNPITPNLPTLSQTTPIQKHKTFLTPLIPPKKQTKNLIPAKPIITIPNPTNPYLPTKKPPLWFKPTSPLSIPSILQTKLLRRCTWNIRWYCLKCLIYDDE